VADKADSSLSQWGRLKLLKVSVSSGEDGSDTVLKARVLDRGLTGRDAPEERQIEGTGNGPVAAFLNALSALDLTISVEDYVEHAMTAGSDALAASYVECKVGEPAQERVIWGVGIDSSVITSTLKAIISAVNRFER
jgi:2-isopropylmalate synthase